ncbi:MAG: 1-phosphofructokinase [Liquorilactobacillus nagelii]|jgi:1-phosphofructokinase|uniref:1-phosphofructokinase n=1 Tax=Liquorilactobacillus nagelii TaxID=82688 RepID=UPI0006EEE226|nr:1-phosphofructokinase [Liquorilactobacillus nagelii]KRL40147.1 1-phosphofructokinase [Liquorilactobacillus nagelii DSM 13675]QYH53220.1 1-phosphofructokinase [Liquorilactobacillus nagelii DSM 13675]
MIYTITLNPAIDLFIDTKKLAANSVNRTNGYDLQANGKGINVSFILNKIGIPTTATGIGGGFTLEYIKNKLQLNHIPYYFTKSQGLTRINVFTRVKSENKEYKLVNPGPEVTLAEQKKLLTYFKEKLKKDDLICISGSFSTGISPDILQDFAKLAEQKQTKLVIDTSYQQVMDILPYHPWIIKPNEDEIKKWFSLTGQVDQKQLVKLGKRLVTKGAQMVLISLGSKGALLITSSKVFYGNAPKIQELNTACAGDSMLGAFIGNLINQKGLETALKKAIAAGSDAARQEWITNFITAKELEKQIKIESNNI